MENNDKIKELFSEKLGAYEAPVNPQLWTSISAQIGVNAAATTGTGLSALAKGIIGAASVGVISVATYFIVSSDDSMNTTEKDKNAVVIESSNDPVKETTSVKQITTLSNEQPQPNGERLNTDTDAVSMEQGARSSEPSSVQELHSSEQATSYQPKVRDDQPIWEKRVDTNHAQGDTAGSKERTNERAVQTGNTDDLVQDQMNTKEETHKRATITLMPNSFTPNGDGVNDEFFIRYEGELLDFHLVIMDTKNNVVHQSNDPDFVWKGNTQGNEPAPEGKYVYMITARDSAGNPVNAYNSLMLMRTP